MTTRIAMQLLRVRQRLVLVLVLVHLPVLLLVLPVLPRALQPWSCTPVSSWACRPLPASTPRLASPVVDPFALTRRRCDLTQRTIPR